MYPYLKSIVVSSYIFENSDKDLLIHKALEMTSFLSKLSSRPDHDRSSAVLFARCLSFSVFLVTETNPWRVLHRSAQSSSWRCRSFSKFLDVLRGGILLFPVGSGVRKFRESGITSPENSITAISRDRSFLRVLVEQRVAFVFDVEDDRCCLGRFSDATLDFYFVRNTMSYHAIRSRNTSSDTKLVILPRCNRDACHFRQIFVFSW